MSHLVAEPLEDRTQPALLALHLPAVAIQMAAEQSVAEIAIVRTVNVFAEFIPSRSEGATSAVPVNNRPSDSPSTPSSSSPVTSVPSGSASIAAGNDASPAASAFPSTTVSLPVPTSAESALGTSAILLPPDGRAVETRSDTPASAVVVLPPAAAPQLETLLVSTDFVPTLLSAVGAGSSSPVEAAPAPREVDTLPIQPEAELPVAPMPREVSVAEPQAVVVEAGTITPPAASQPAASMFSIVEVPEAVESNWGWIGAASAVLLAGGYWVMRTLRLRRPATSVRAAAKRLPYGTILSTDLQPA